MRTPYSCCRLFGIAIDDRKVLLRVVHMFLLLDVYVYNMPIEEHHTLFV